MLFGDNIFLCRHGFGNTWRVLHLRHNVHIFFDNLFIFQGRIFKFKCIKLYRFILNPTKSILICELFGPLYFNLGITSTYEYLEARFSRSVRLHISVVFIVQNVLYIGMAINSSPHVKFSDKTTTT